MVPSASSYRFSNAVVDGRLLHDVSITTGNGFERLKILFIYYSNNVFCSLARNAPGLWVVSLSCQVSHLGEILRNYFPLNNSLNIPLLYGLPQLYGSHVHSSYLLKYIKKMF